MKNITLKYIKLVDFLNKIFGYALAFSMAFMSVIIFWQVFSRYVVGSSLAWSEELSRFLMIYMVAIGSALALRDGKLIAVEIIPEILKGKVKRILIILVHLISIVFYIILMIYGLKVAESFGNQIAPGTHISMYFIYLSLPIGGLLLLLNSVTCILEQFIEGKE
ncbi:TRAP transporter small permease [Schinkia azotoformans]|uniref:TRAP transporter small transmembrane protein n=1 Tax=Schinkia azotoformans LMG 9581 TaxID=1131731 RepID=K6D4N1_SCHAZ|nr:TRAP transporter small permease [Schinkia azotoformans]EKN63249.1 TRAP transporter small transmembrane protein [Schinkia azotoformans LMG 9581]MEC1637201.1 TRAP transporter small permease [Schinkia azotoformans]MEC1720649.1 TRAP transporter small permease [Schinkia azotoformans]MEC1943605.1 TRAP transporter small permease [Schinkia azotoformans]MED4411788.1 TRAP transporter small permease [Schinkia azotoformans]